MKSTSYFCRILMKLESSRQIFEKVSNIKLNKNPPSWSRVFPCGQTDRWTDGHDEYYSRLSQFCERTVGGMVVFSCVCIA